MSELSFCFESNQVRVLGTIVNPLFVALDICKALGFTNHRKAIGDHVDPEDVVKCLVETNGGKQEVNCVNESGMYALIFGSNLPSAKRLKKWVTSDLLPTIRKTRQYSTTEKSSEAFTITPEQQYLLKEAVKRKAKMHAAHYQTIYRAIYTRYKIARYDQLPKDKFKECLQFITEINPNIPINPDRAIVRPERCPVCGLIPVPEGSKVFTREDQKKIAEAIRPLLQDAMDSMRKIEEERSHAWTCFHEISLYLCKIC